MEHVESAVRWIFITFQMADVIKESDLSKAMRARLKLGILMAILLLEVFAK